MWYFFASAHGKVMVLVLSSKDSFERNNLMLMVPNYKMQKKLFNFCVSIYQKDQRHHTQVQKGLHKGYFGW
jgi:hypothetical protein